MARFDASAHVPPAYRPCQDLLAFAAAGHSVHSACSNISHSLQNVTRSANALQSVTVVAAAGSGELSHASAEGCEDVKEQESAEAHNSRAESEGPPSEGLGSRGGASLL